MGPWALLALAGIGLYVWKGQQYILRQPDDTLWYSDPFQFDSAGYPGNRMFYTGEIPPGEAPPWRLASEAERIALEQAEAGF
jgi:hypothetical protein